MDILIRSSCRLLYKERTIKVFGRIKDTCPGINTFILLARSIAPTTYVKTILKFYISTAYKYELSRRTRFLSQYLTMICVAGNRDIHIRFIAYLERNGIHDHEQQTKLPRGLVGSVRPQSVSTGCDSQAAQLIQQDRCNRENHWR